MSKKSPFENYPKINTKKMKYLNSKSSFKFQCKYCGLCCFNNSIIMTPFDVLNIMENKEVCEFLKVKTTNDLFKRKRLRLILGSGSKIPFVIPETETVETDSGQQVQMCSFLVPLIRVEKGTLKKIAKPEFIKLLSQKLSEKKTLPDYYTWGCVLGSAKPLICASSPIGRIGAVGQEMKFVYQKPHPECLGHNKGQKYNLGKWLSKFKLEDRYHDSTLYYSEVVDLLVKTDIQNWDNKYSFALGGMLYNWDLVTNELGTKSATSLFIEDKITFLEYLVTMTKKMISRK